MAQSLLLVHAQGSLLVYLVNFIRDQIQVIYVQGKHIIHCTKALEWIFLMFHGPSFLVFMWE